MPRSLVAIGLAVAVASTAASPLQIDDHLVDDQQNRRLTAQALYGDGPFQYTELPDMFEPCGTEEPSTAERMELDLAYALDVKNHTALAEFDISTMTTYTQRYLQVFSLGIAIKQPDDWNGPNWSNGGRSGGLAEKQPDDWVDSVHPSTGTNTQTWIDRRDDNWTPDPSPTPTLEPSLTPSTSPSTVEPTNGETDEPTSKPGGMNSNAMNTVTVTTPSQMNSMTRAPTSRPSSSPRATRTSKPTRIPTSSPRVVPSRLPTKEPIIVIKNTRASTNMMMMASGGRQQQPMTPRGTRLPSDAPSDVPSDTPSSTPSSSPTHTPTTTPTHNMMTMMSRRRLNERRVESMQEMTIQIPIHFHVFTKDDMTGGIDETAVKGGFMEALAEAFESSPFRFRLDSVSNIKNDGYFGCNGVAEYRQRRHRGGRESLNVYVCDLVGQGLGSMSSLPSIVTSGREKWNDGITIMNPALGLAYYAHQLLALAIFSDSPKKTQTSAVQE